MSVLCSTALTRSVRDEKLTETNQILDRTRQIIVERLAVDRGKALRDGMDIALIRLSKANPAAIQFSGGNRALLIAKPDDLIELKGDRQPVGYAEEVKSFTAQTIEVPSGTMLYLATDGYSDQMGGPHRKKLGSKAFRSLLREIACLEPPQQILRLTDAFEGWKGATPQVEDVTVVGIQWV